MPGEHKANPRVMSLHVEALIANNCGNNANGDRIVLAGGDVRVNSDELNGWYATITGGRESLVGLTRRVIDYDQPGNHVVVSPPFPLAPDDDTPETYALWRMLTTKELVGLCPASGNHDLSNIVLNRKEPWYDGDLVECDLEIFAGTAAKVGHWYRIVKYQGGENFVVKTDPPIATISGQFSATPDATSWYRVRGHFYHPVTAFKIREAALGTFEAGTPAALPFDQAIAEGSELGDDDVGLLSELAVAMKAGTGRLTIQRWE